MKTANTLKYLVAALASLAFLVATSATAQPLKFFDQRVELSDHEGREPFPEVETVKGSKSTKQKCEKMSTRIWVQMDGWGECIRYWVSNTPNQKFDEVEIEFFGDGVNWPRMNGRLETVITMQMKRQSPISLQSMVDSRSTWLNMPSFYVSRPGVLGSSGETIQITGSRDEMIIMGKVVQELSTKYNFGKINIIGNSGGGVVAASLALSRSDIKCAVLGAAPLDRKISMNGDNRLDKPLTHFYNAQAELSQLKNSSTRFVIVSDIDDKRVSYASQTSFIESANQLRLDLVDIAYKASFNHNVEAEAKLASELCIQGLPSSVLKNKVIPK